MTELEKLQKLTSATDELAKVYWTCSRCGLACNRPDNGHGRQMVSCVCGQGVILLNTSREDWIG